MTRLRNTRSAIYIKQYNEIVKQIVQIAQALTVPDDTLNVQPVSFYYCFSLGDRSNVRYRNKIACKKNAQH